MPTSNSAGKDWIGAIFMALKSAGKVKRVLDIGAGEGTYSILGRSRDVEWVGVEGWGPYVEEFKLNDKYDKIIISDARYLDYSMLGNFDVCFLGDILEHMTKDEACFIVRRLCTTCRYIFISMPIVKYPQDAVDKNPFQTHIKDDWSNKEVLESFPAICAGMNVNEIGIYLLVPHEQDRQFAETLAAEARKICYGQK